MQAAAALTALLFTFWVRFVVLASQDALELLVHDRRLLDAQQHGFINVTLSHGKLAGSVSTLTCCEEEARHDVWTVLLSRWLRGIYGASPRGRGTIGLHHCQRSEDGAS